MSKMKTLNEKKNLEKIKGFEGDCKQTKNLDL